MLRYLFSPALLLASAVATPWNISITTKEPLRVETFVNHGDALDMVSSLVIGSEAALLIDAPLTVSSAENLTAWVKATTDKPVVAMFSSHNHPDHYLSAGVIAEAFPNATYYASPEAVRGIAIEAAVKAAYWGPILGASEVVENPVIPTPFNFTFFTLPGDSDQPVHLIQPLTGDTIDETMFWLPGSRTLIAGDTVFGTSMHLYMADMLTPELTSSWIATLDFLAGLQPEVLVPGHSLHNESWASTAPLEYTREYLCFWQSEIEAKGAEYYTPEELYAILDSRFPGRLSANSAELLNITAGQFGRGGTGFPHIQDLTVYTNEGELDGWQL